MLKLRSVGGYRLSRVFAGLGFVAAVCVMIGVDTASAGSITLFWEDFDGYKVSNGGAGFPDEHPPGDPVNLGLPQISEGADELWYGARFEVFDTEPLSDDLAVQSQGGGTNSTPVGRVEDEAGMMFPLDLTNYENVTLEYDWRMFSAEESDELVVGYTTLDLLGDFDGNRLTDFEDTYGPQTGNTLDWWTDNWVELHRASQSTFQHKSFSLPSNVPILWVAFWIDDGNKDFAKIDNIHVSGDLIPEPASAGLLGLGLVCLLSRRRQA